VSDRRRRHSSAATATSAPDLVDLNPRQFQLVRPGAPSRQALLGAATGTKYLSDGLVVLGG
jgi:hypothetical protein